jgi:predicted HicB family RNase H-like nuclease
MNKTIIDYKGYSGSVEISLEDGCLHGRILFIDDLITYEGETISEVQKEFASSVDRYLTYCEKTGNPPNKPFSGTFNVRIGPDLHRKAAREAGKRNISLNDYVVQAIKFATDQDTVLKVEHTHHFHFVMADGSAQETIMATTDRLSGWEIIDATMQ